MLAFSAPLYSTLGWPTEEHIRQDQKNWVGNDSSLNCNHRETEALNPCLPFTSLEQQVDLDDSIPSSAMNNDPAFVKKLSHNAEERNRRKKLNNLYSSLASILPGTDNTRKLSIPATISRALKYIPELQKKVENLKQRKEEILATVYKRGNIKNIERQRNGIVRKSLPTVLVSQIHEREIMIQICTSKKNTRSPFSEVLLSLEDEDLQLLNVSTSGSSGEVVFFDLHLQMRENQRLNCDLLSQKLLSMCENKDELF